MCSILFFLGFRLVIIVVCSLLNRFTPIRATIVQDPTNSSSRVILSVPIKKFGSDIVVTTSIPFPTLSLIWTVKKQVHVDVEIKRLGYKKDSPKNTDRLKSPSRFPLALTSWLPPIKFQDVLISVRFPSPPATETPADQACGKAWTTAICLTNLRMKMKDSDILVSLEKGFGECTVEEEKMKFFQLINFSSEIPLKSSTRISKISIESIFTKMGIEMFYSVFPTISPWIEMEVSTGINGPQDWGKKLPNFLPFAIELKISEKFVFETSTKTAGTCRIQVPQILAQLSRNLESSLSAEGCIVTRDSPLYGHGKIIHIPGFKVSGDTQDLNLSFPKASLNMIPDGFVYWLRALLMVGNKVSFVKRPYRIDIRNERVKAYYDYCLSGVEPENGWENLKQYYPRIVPLRIRLDFGSLDVQTERGERLISEEAFVDCNLPLMEISFNASNIELFGASKKRCAIISSFAGWVPQFSSVRLKDVHTDWMGKPPSDIDCHHVQLDPLGPIPVNIRFADIDVEIADDLVMLLGQQVMEGVDSVRRWDIDPGYCLVPMYKTVTIRLSRVRFAPAELKPAVLHVDDWELAVGPTKDCLSFAFMGIKAWVPCTITVPPIVHVTDPVLVHLRVKRLVPLEHAVLASDYASQPGAWRELTLNVPFVHAAVAPGLHATTRFIDRTMKTVKKSLTSVKPVNAPMSYRKGPIKNVDVAAKGLQIVVIRQTLREARSRAMCTEDVSESTGKSLCEAIADIRVGSADICMKNFSLVDVNLSSLNVNIPTIASLNVSSSTVFSSDGERFDIALSTRAPIEFKITENAMAILGAYSALRESFSKAWVISQAPPKLQSLITHMMDANVNSFMVRSESLKSIESIRRSISSQPPSSPPSRGNSATSSLTLAAGTPLLNFDLTVQFPKGLVVDWSIPNMHANFGLCIPGGNNLKVCAVFHGFALLGDEVVRRLPDLDDEILIQWLRYPWSLGSPDASPRSPSLSREKNSWELHTVMTNRISEYLSFAGTDGRWEYASTRGPIDTPVYAQLVVQMSQMEITIGKKRMFGLDNLEFRCHCHNLPTSKFPPSVTMSSAPKLNVSFWTSLVQDPAGQARLTLDFVPDIHLPILLQLVGSPADTDPSVLSGFLEAEDFSATPPTPTPPLTARTRSPAGPSMLEKLLDEIDLGFRATLVGITGRAAGFTFASTKLCMFKEEDNGKGILVCDIRDAQVAIVSSATLSDATQPFHSRVCLGVPLWSGVPPDHEVFPFISVKQMMLHIGLEANEVFCNIQGGRVWWSPSLNRAMRLSLERTDKTVDMMSKWKTRFVNELFARMGKSRSKKKTLESIMKFFDFLIPSSGQIKLFLRCADVQANMHNVLNGGGLDDLLAGGVGTSGGTSGTSWEGSNSTPSKSPDIPRHFQPFREVSPKTNGTSPPISRPQSPNGFNRRIFCPCCSQSGEDLKHLELFLKKHHLDLAIPKNLSWWTVAGHMKGCPLPPVPLALYFSPPNSKRERAIGGVKFESWISEFLGKLSPISVNSPTVTSGGPIRPKPRGSQLLLSSKESVFEIHLIRTRSPSNIHVNFNAAFNALQGSVAPTALRGLVWLGQPGQNILRPILTIQRVSLVLSSDLFPLKTARVRLLIPKISVSADDDAFHLILDVFRNCLLYRGALIDPNPTYSSLEKKKTQKSTAPATRNSVKGPISAAKREMIVESILQSLAVSDANLPASADDLSAEYVVESVSLNLTHRQRCFIQLQLVDLAGKHAFSLSHPHRPMIFSVQVRDISILSGDSTVGGVSASGSNTKTVLRSAGGHGNLITVRGNDRYTTLNNREWHIYDTLFLSMAPIVVDVNQDLIEELYAFIFPPESAGESVAGNQDLAGSGMRRLSSANLILKESEDQPISAAQEIVGNKLLTGRNKLRVSSSMLTPPLSPRPASETTSKIPASPGSKSNQPVPPPTSASDAELVLFKFVRFSNIDLIITFKGKQFSLNNLSLTLKYYLRRRKLCTWKEFLDEWGSKVGKQAVGSFVKHGFTRKRGIQDIIVGKLNQFTSSEKELDKILFGKFASHKEL